MRWNEIIQRLFEVYETSTQKELAKMLNVTPALVSRWLTEDRKEKRNPTWKTLCKAIDEKGVTWDWLLEGREPKYRHEPFAGVGANETTNPNRNIGVMQVETNPLGGINDKKRTMADTTIVDALNDHIETLKQQNARLQAEVESLREENKHLLTLSPERDTRQAKSG